MFISSAARFLRGAMLAVAAPGALLYGSHREPRLLMAVFRGGVICDFHSSFIERSAAMFTEKLAYVSRSIGCRIQLRRKPRRRRPLLMEQLERRIALTVAVRMEYRLETTDLAGNPITTITAGSDFLLRGTVQDVRPEPLGVFAGWVDVNYDAGFGLAHGPIEHGPNFPVGGSGDTSVPGLIDDVGSFSESVTPLGPGEMLLFSVPMKATSAGLLNFTLDPVHVFSPAHDTLLYVDLAAHPDEHPDVDPAEMSLVNTSITVTPAPRMQYKLTTTDLLGNPISTVTAGNDFLLRGTVQDLRADPQGVFAGYIDVNYDTGLGSVDGSIVHGPNYPFATSGDTTTPGLIDDVGSFFWERHATWTGRNAAVHRADEGDERGFIEFRA
jgi:hypothetical protein